MVSTDRPVALVTGASRGIGAATAVALARDGFDIALAARTVPDLDAVAERCREHGARAAVVPADLREEADVRTMVTRAVDGLGELDALVDNAGGTPFAAPLVDTRPDGWEKLLRLNLTQVFWCLQAAGVRTDLNRMLWEDGETARRTVARAFPGRWGERGRRGGGVPRRSPCVLCHRSDHRGRRRPDRRDVNRGSKRAT